MGQSCLLNITYIMNYNVKHSLMCPLIIIRLYDDLECGNRCNHVGCFHGCPPGIVKSRFFADMARHNSTLHNFCTVYIQCFGTICIKSVKWLRFVGTTQHDTV